MPSHPARAVIVRRYCSALAVAIMSTGLRTDASAGRKEASSACSSSGSGGTSRPTASQASAHMIAGPPALVTIPTRSPDGSGWPKSSEATSSSSDSVSVRITPHCSKRASTVESDAASSAPVWELAARAPAADRPLLTATTGLLPADAAGDPGEPAGVAERLEVEQGESRALVLLPELEEVGRREVGRLPGGANVDTPRPLAPRRTRSAQAVGAALSGEGDVAGGGGVGGKARSSCPPRGRVEQAEAVGADEAHPGLAAAASSSRSRRRPRRRSR